VLVGKFYGGFAKFMFLGNGNFTFLTHYFQVCCTHYSGVFFLYYLFFGIQIYFDGENMSDADHVEQFRIEMAFKFWLISIYYLVLFIVAVLCAVGSGAAMYSAYLERNKYLVYTIKGGDVESGKGILDGVD
jgi:hypothetical protein